MAVIQLRSFTGEIPRTPAHLLPENAAQSAIDCDFSYGELRGIKATVATKTMSGSAMKSFYTEDGNNFYAWPEIVETAVSPVIGDVHRRLYYTIGDGADIRVVARNGAYAEPPTASGKKPTGYKLGVPGPAHEIFNGLAGLEVKLINYDPMAAPLVASGQSWTPVIDGLMLQIKFFYELDGAKHQEVDVLNVYDGAYYSGASPACYLQPSARYSDGTGGGDRIYGRDFHVAHPARDLTTETETVRTVETVYDPDTYQSSEKVTETVVVKRRATPDTATPTLQVTGFINNVQVFSVYSEGSSFASIRGAVGAKLFANRSTDGTVLYCGLKYGINETRSYVYTHVNIFDEESAPSLPVTIDVGHGQTPELSLNFSQLGSGANTYAPIKLLRTYGTNATSQGNADWYFVSEGGGIENFTPGVLTAIPSAPFPAGAQTKNPAEYGERLTTQDYTLPPAGATGLCALPNGILACHIDSDAGTNIPGKGQNEVWFCEPYRPSAWPGKYAISFPWAVVGIKPQANGLLVITKGHPYFVYGTHPGSMTSIKLPALQAGVSKKSIVDTGQFVVYASNDGLVAASNTDVNIELSQRYFTRDVWRTLYGTKLSDLTLAHHDGYLIGYFSDGSKGFVIRMDEAAGAFSALSETASCHFVSAETDQLLMASGVTISAFAGGARKAFSWRSKDIIMPAPVCLGAGHVILDDSETGSIDVSVYADGALRHSVAVSSSGYFRLPSGYLARRWSVKMTGSRAVKELYLATAMREFARV